MKVIWFSQVQFNVVIIILRHCSEETMKHTYIIMVNNLNIQIVIIIAN